MVHYIGLDLSLTGSATVIVDDIGNVVDYGSWGYSLSRNDSEKEKIERIIFIVKNILDMVGRFSDNMCVAIERPAYRKIGAQVDLGEIQCGVKLQLYLAFKTVPDMIVASYARKRILGTGRFSKGKKGKKEIIKAVNNLGFETSDDNIADAYVIAQCLRLQKMEIKNGKC